MSAALHAPRRWRPWAGLAALAWAGACGTAMAVMVAGPGGTAEQGRRLVVAAPAAGAEQPTLTLIAGRIEAVDSAGRWLQLQGQQVALHPSALRVLGPQGPLARGVADLRPGQAIRFALEAPPVAASPAQAQAAAGPQRIVLILLEARP